MNNRHPWPLKKSKSWGPFWSYQQNSTANSANPPRKWAKWAELVVLFSWQLQKGPQDFDFFNCHGCKILISAEIHYFLSALKSCHNNFLLSRVKNYIIMRLPSLRSLIIPMWHLLYLTNQKSKGNQYSHSIQSRKITDFCWMNIVKIRMYVPYFLIQFPQQKNSVY